MYLFILSPPYSGSTLLSEIIGTSPNVSSLPEEGQFLDELKDIMREKPWDPDYSMQWDYIRKIWESYWDLSKPILLEKSPPNIIRALRIQELFQKSYFLIMIRNPYAMCEGLNRRNGTPFAKAAQFWVKCAQYQMENSKKLENSLSFSYEDLTDSKAQTCQRIMEFLPELNSLDIDRSFKVHSVLAKDGGNKDKGIPLKIQNLNPVKIGTLSRDNIRQINSVLEKHAEIMSFFGYSCLSADEHVCTLTLRKKLIRFRDLQLIRFKRKVKKSVKSLRA